MATAVHIPLSEYLRTVYRPDCDYVDGEVQERNSGEQTHSLVQTAIAAIFYANRKSWQLRPLTEQRVQVKASRYRVPDVCVVRSTDPIEPILQKPPALCVEVLSPEDRFQRILQRAQEYQAMGVESIWIIDPETREAWTMAYGGGPVPLVGHTLTLPGTPASLTIAEIFDEIDSAPEA